MFSLEDIIFILGDAEALEKFGIRLKALRLRRNLSQEYVAGVVGVSVPTYRKIEQGDGTVEFRHVARAFPHSPSHFPLPLPPPHAVGDLNYLRKMNSYFRDYSRLVLPHALCSSAIRSSKTPAHVLKK